MTEGQASGEEVELRISWFYSAILDGYSQRDAVHIAATTTEWGAALTKRWLRNLYQRAEASMADEAREIDRRGWLVKSLRRYELLYQKAYSAESLTLAASMQDRIVDLLNLSAATALSIDWRDQAVSLGIDPGELFDRLLVELSEQDARNAE